jgi:hypothetical protein
MRFERLLFSITKNLNISTETGNQNQGNIQLTVDAGFLIAAFAVD